MSLKEGKCICWELFSASVHGNESVSPNATVWLTDFVFGQQWNFVAQSNKMCQALETLETKHLLVGSSYCWFWSFFVGFADN